MNRFEKSLERIKNILPQDNWTEEDWEHYKTVIEALELAAQKGLKNEVTHTE